MKELDLEYIVVTSVNRDDRPDGGAGHFAAAITALRRESPRTIVEVLIPDFQGVEKDLATVAEARPHVVAHNIETVERLTPTVRDRRAKYRQSLEVLEYLKQRPEKLYTKSSIMVGLGETDDELVQTFRDLRRAGVDVLTLGQYLQPSQYHLRVERFASPGEVRRVPPARERDGVPLRRVRPARALELPRRRVLHEGPDGPRAARLVRADFRHPVFEQNE